MDFGILLFSGVEIKLSYLVFARKYRPQKFNEVIGQEQVVFTLLNSLKYNRIAQAYIFSGPRGVGKTTIARIYAKALNCLNIQKDMEPCCECENCVSIKNGNNIDVVEIDGASNTGIDDIRKLRENVKFPPSTSKYKVIIIDEVHMLSKSAFNGLLKTLEEPPDYIIFMFATTELHKIPETILSRCQKFYFNRIADSKMIDTLKNITETENIKIDEKLFHYIVKKSDGCLRDAQSLLDQIVSYSGKDVKYEEIINIFGIVEVEVYLKIIDAVINNDYKTVVNEINDYLSKGKDFNQFLQELLEQFHLIILTKSLGTGLIDLKSDISTSVMSKYMAYADQFSMFQLRNIIDAIINSINLAKYSNQLDILVEMTLFKIIEIKNSINLEYLINKLNEFENLIKKDGVINISASRTETTIQHPEKKEKINKIKIDEEPESEKKLGIIKILNDYLNSNNEVMLANGFKNAYIDSEKDSRLKIGFSKISKVQQNIISNEKPKIADILSNLLNKKVEIEFNFGSSKEDDVIQNLIKEKQTNIPREVYENNTVKKVLDLFGGEIVKVE